jgi:hypothetical protein
MYTDRQDYIDFFVTLALDGIRRRTKATVLIGPRRMGKTEIFVHTINRLFFEQDHTGPQAVIPVYYKFPEEVTDRWEFCLDYVENFLRWYVAFRMRNVELLSPKALLLKELPEFIQSNMPVTKGLSGALNILRGIQQHGITMPEREVLSLPRGVAEWDDSTIAVFLDEFQNTHLPQNNFRISGFMQEAVESNTCPHFVTGSAMSMLADILGRGALFGRFLERQISPLTDYYGAELALRAARYYGVTLPEEMSPVVTDRCGGNPFYITALVQQAARTEKAVCDEIVLNELLAVDICSGFIWSELHDQVTRWIHRINEYGITKWVLYLAVLEEHERLSLDRIKEELWQRDHQDIEIETIRDVLVKLSRGDLIEYQEFGGWFGKVKDPILEEFLKVWGRIEVLGESRESVQTELVSKYHTLQRRFAEYKGYLAEVFMSQVLWNGKRVTLPGTYFHSPEDIQMPDRFFYIDQRHRIRAGNDLEIDLYAAAGTEIWIAQSKWWRDRKVGIDTVKHLLRQAELVKERQGASLETLRIWLFACNGVTDEAEKLLNEHHILWSTRADLDALLQVVNLRTLPEM